MIVCAAVLSSWQVHARSQEWDETARFSAIADSVAQRCGGRHPLQPIKLLTLSAQWPSVDKSPAECRRKTIVLGTQ
eukprot:2198207-Amphidinium_carterae.1